jgi:hypothetical protein
MPKALARLTVVACLVSSCRSSVSPKQADIAQGPGCPMVECDDSRYGTGSMAGIFHGRYRSGFEDSTFEPDGLSCEYWLCGDIESLREALWQRAEHLGETGADAQVVIEGMLSAPGCYGHAGFYGRQLEVTNVLSARVQGAQDGEWVSLALPMLPTPTPIGPLSPDKLRP